MTHHLIYPDPEAPSTASEIAEHSAGECVHTIKDRCERLAKSGYRATLVLTIEDVIRDYRLDRLKDAAE